jgi:hypothetical protein
MVEASVERCRSKGRVESKIEVSAGKDRRENTARKSEHQGELRRAKHPSLHSLGYLSVLETELSKLQITKRHGCVFGGLRAIEEYVTEASLIQQVY